MASKSEIKGRLIFAPIMLVGGLLIFFLASIPKLKEAQATKKWEQVSGQITDVWIIAHRDGHDMPNRDNPVSYRGDEGIKFRLGLEYTYTVDKEYKSRTRYLMESPRDGYKKYSIAEMKSNYYRSNTDVEVFYNPALPHKSLLRTGLKPIDFLVVISPLFAVLIGLLLLVSIIRTVLGKSKKDD